MKNFPKKNNDKDKRKSNSKNYRKSPKIDENKKNSVRKNNNLDIKNLKKRDKYITNDYIDLNSNEKHKNYSYSRRKISSDKSNSENLSKYSPKNNLLNTNNKNYEDWIWGKHSVFAALNSNRPVNRIWCTSEIFSSEKFFLLLKEFRSKGVLIEEVSWSRLSQLTYGAAHQGVALQLASSNTISLKDLIEISKRQSSNPIIVALDGITDPHNLGAIIRSAEAFDCKGIIIPQRRSAGLTGTVAKVAAGALEHIPVSRVVNLNRAIDELKKNGFLTIGLSGEGQVSISKFKEKAPLVVIVGSENKGISLLTQRNCDYLLKIPLKGKTNSLNASVAAAISFYYLSKT